MTERAERNGRMEWADRSGRTDRTDRNERNGSDGGAGRAPEAILSAGRSGAGRDRSGAPNITRNVHVIEFLKCNLLADLSSLFGKLFARDEDESGYRAADVLASLISGCYILGRRLGISFDTIDMKIKSNLKIGTLQKNELEREFSDLSALAEHLDGTRRFLRR